MHIKINQKTYKIHILILERTVKAQYWLSSYHFNLSLLQMLQKWMLQPRDSNIDIFNSTGPLRTILISKSIKNHTAYTFWYLNGLLRPNINLVLIISIYHFSRCHKKDYCSPELVTLIFDFIRLLSTICISKSIRKHTKYTFWYLKGLLSPNIDLVLTISIYHFCKCYKKDCCSPEFVILIYLVLFVH